MYNKFFQNASLHFWAAVLTAAVFYLKHIHSDYKEKEVEEEVITHKEKKETN